VDECKNGNEKNIKPIPQPSRLTLLKKKKKKNIKIDNSNISMISFKIPSLNKSDLQSLNLISRSSRVKLPWGLGRRRTETGER
jgi:hypothetical protein